MPIRSAIWKVSPQPQPLVESSLANEKLLEDMIVLDMRILSSEWILIGRQEITREEQRGQTPLFFSMPGNSSSKQRMGDCSRIVHE